MAAISVHHSVLSANSTDAAREVDRLLSRLDKNTEAAELTPAQEAKLLANLKVLGRDVKAAGPIFTKRGIRILSRYGLDRANTDSSREALRCLANALLLNEQSRQTFVDLSYPSSAAKRLKTGNVDDEFLIARILFLLTYNTDLDFEVLIDATQLADSINECITRHADYLDNETPTHPQPSSMQEMALAETSKLIFNIIYYYPSTAARFMPCLKPIVSITTLYPLCTPPLQPPLSHVINALLNLELPTADDGMSPAPMDLALDIVFPSSSPNMLMARLISILDAATDSHTEDDLEQAAAPLCTLLRRFYALAPSAVKESIRTLLLPTEQDRDQPLGRGRALSDRLLRLSTSPRLPTLKENISRLLFELSDEDPNKFVENIGYGFASGFLMSQNLHASLPSDERGDATNSDTTRLGIGVNPVTGQRLDSEARDAPDVAEMTEEEKEREAERLFVLFERLKATGVMDVKNPVQQAIDDGKFEELD